MKVDSKRMFIRNTIILVENKRIKYFIPISFLAWMNTIKRVWIIMSQSMRSTNICLENMNSKSTKVKSLIKGYLETY